MAKKKTRFVATRFVAAKINSFRGNSFRGRKKNSFRGQAAALVVKFDHEFSHEIIVLTVQLTGNRLPLYSWLPSIHFSYFFLVFTIVLLLGIGVRFINKFQVWIKTGIIFVSVSEPLHTTLVLIRALGALW